VVGVALILLAGAFPLLSLLKPLSRERAEEEHPLISRGIAKKSTASFQHVQPVKKQASPKVDQTHFSRHLPQFSDFDVLASKRRPAKTDIFNENTS